MILNLKNINNKFIKLEIILKINFNNQILII